MDIFRSASVLFLLPSVLFYQVTFSQNNTAKNVTVNGIGNGYIHANTTVDNATCKLRPTVLAIRDEIGNLANAEYQLVKLKIKVEGTNITSRNIYSTSGYHPRDWVIATSTTGKAMLMLREYFEPMSMYTLGYGVANFEIILEQHPANCLDNIGVAHIENLMRNSILSNFGSDIPLPETAEVCNQHVVTKGTGLANILYVCCKNDLSQGGTIQCVENTETVWIKMLFVSLFLIQGFFVAYCPLILPDTLFKARTVFQNYVFKTQPDKSLVLNVKVVDSTTHVSDENFVKTRRHTFTHLSGFRKHINQMRRGMIYSMYVNGVNMSVRGSKIIADGSAPVGVLNFIYQFFIRCALKTEIQSLGACCNTKLCKSVTPNINFRWYQCLRMFMLLLSLAVCASPLILRVWFYYAYEQDVIQYKQELYKTLNLTMPFTGFVVSYLSPTHPLFIVIYGLLGFEVVFYLPQPDAVKRKLKFTIRKCFRDIHARSRMKACGYFMSKLLYPLTRFGIVGCLIAPLYVTVLPILLLLLALDALPIANLTIRLFANLVYYILRMISPQTFNFVSMDDNGKCERWINNRLSSLLVTDFQEQNSRGNQLIHALSLIFTLASIGCILFLAVDCISFYVECMVYGLVGFILNPKDIMKYVSLLLLIVVYGVECFKGVKGKYVAYGQAINSQVQTMIGERLKEIASQNAKDQVNSAFRIEGKDNTEPMYLVAGSERYLKWRALRLVLFLDNSDIPYIPKSFLMRMAKLQHAFCPGQVHMLYLKALLDFSMIVLFLSFVFIVIFAFGQAQDISSGGQAIAALGSGFLPLILRKFLFQTHSGSCVDTSNMKWHFMFKNAVEQYKDRWNFEDIHVTHIKLARQEAANPVEESSADGEDNNISDDANISSDIALLPTTNEPKSDAPNVNVDLIIKAVQHTTDENDLEFYVPVTRATECEDDELLNDDGISETVV